MRLLIIAWTFVHLSAAVSTLGRCCRRGEVLVLNDNLECVKSPNEQLQQLLGPRSVQPKGLPSCGKDSHLLQVLPEDLVEVAVEACLELFHDEASTLNFAVVVQCSRASESSPRMQYFRFLAREVTKPPRIVQVRKCCPGNTVYDPDRRFCVDAELDADFRVLFDRLPTLDFIDVYVHGPPSCRDAVLLDFRLQQLYDSTNSISMSIPQSGSPRNVTISADTTCLDSFGDELIARVCSDIEYCEENVCVRKCCEEHDQDDKCAAAAPTSRNFSDALSNIKNYGLVTGIPCKMVYGPNNDDESWWVEDTGDIIIQSYEYSYVDTYSYKNACVEFMTDERQFTVITCFGDDDYIIEPTAKWAVAGSLQLVSCLFLALTLTVYCCLPSLQNLHGKTLMCHVGSLCIAYATLAVVGLATSSIDYFEEKVANSLCKAMSYILLFSFHSAFFWLNVMCFDIWWTFRGIRETKRQRQRNRFLAYCAYAWGLALFFVLLLLTLEAVGVLDNVVGRERCWFEYHSITQVVFFLLPVSLTLVVNLLFFLVTARRCSKVKAEISRAMANDKSDKKFRSDRSRLIMNVKLFIVMGIPWLFENLNSFLEHYETLPLWAQEMFYAVDAVNCLQGLWIFILFVLKSKVYVALRKRLRPRLKQQKSSSTSNTLSVKPNSRVRKSASSSTLTSCFLVSSQGGT